MEEGVLPLSTVVGNPSDSLMDFDYMDELLLEGCWLEAAGSEFPHFDCIAPISPFEPSFVWPALEFNNGESGGSPCPSKVDQEERQRSSFPENLSISQSRGPQHSRKSQSHVENISNPVVSSAQSMNYSVEGSEQSKRWWIGPRASMSVMERLIQALGYMKSCSGDKDVLIQVWVPVTKGGKRVLTTSNQPFSLDLNCPKLAHYREISVNYHFPADENSKEVVGLPGRVYRNKVPEWTPDVRFFSWEEYPRVGHAQQYDVRGTLAVPILEQGSRDCLGVIEVILTKQKIKYRPELESVCKALEAVDLRSPEASNTQKVKTCDLSYQAAIPEILEVLRSACETHGLPLAQTWVPCILQGNGGCWNSDENLKNCIAPVTFYAGDSRVKGFHEACSDYHLLKGQGIVGRAFQTNQPCFSTNVSACSKTDYPLSHHARMFGLKAAVAIRLRSTSTGSADFVLEFFLPTNCDSPEEHKNMLTSLSTIIQNVCQTLRVVTDNELKEEAASPDNVANSPVKSIDTEVPKVDHMQFSSPYSRQVIHRESEVSPYQTGREKVALAESSEVRLGQPDSNSKEGMTFAANTSTSCDGSSVYTNKTGEKRRIKADKTITLEVLRQHFAGSLKDAAKNLGVCPTTLKRICRQHGIQRWPSRKIKKVGHSLQKIQRVIDSVQGASAGLQIGSFYSNFPELASPNASRTTQFSKSTSADNLKPLEAQPEGSVLIPPPTASLSPSSSGSQNSSSSQCCSSGVQQNVCSLSVGGHDNLMVNEEPMLKRTRSDANLHVWNDEAKPLLRSQSHISFCWPDKQENVLPAADDNSSQKSRERDGPRIKVTYGEDTIRFRMQSDWRYKDLLHEISRRFGVDNAGGYHLKYLDDDAEWVLLTCDADLEECIDVCRAAQSQTIRLSFLHDFQSQVGRSFSTRGPSSL